MCRIIDPATSMSIAISACCRRSFDAASAAALVIAAVSSIAESKSPTSSRSSRLWTTGAISVPQRASSCSIRSRSSSRRRSSDRRALAATLSTQTARRSGGSSLACSTSTARVRAPDSSRAYSSDTKVASEYEVSSFSATWFQTVSKPSVWPNGDAAASSWARLSRRWRSSGFLTSV